MPSADPWVESSHAWHEWHTSYSLQTSPPSVLQQLLAGPTWPTLATDTRRASCLVEFLAPIGQRVNAARVNHSFSGIDEFLSRLFHLRTQQTKRERVRQDLW